MTRYVTVKQLTRAGACRNYLNLFKALFGRNGKVAVTPETCNALATFMCFNWASRTLLSARQRRVYANNLARNYTPLTPLSLSASMQAYRNLIPNFTTLDFDTRWRIDDAAREQFLNKLHRAQAHAFYAAYNSPRK
jgi:hypothetical protein